MKPLRRLLRSAVLLLTLACVTACGDSRAGGAPDGGGGPGGGGGADAAGGTDGAAADAAPAPDAGAGADGGGAAAAPADGAALPDAAGAADVPQAPDAAPNTAPTFAAPPPVTLEQGRPTTVDLNPLVADAEDADALLVIEWTAAHVALADPGDHVLLVVAPVDWFGTEAIPLTVADRGGLTATATLTVVVEEAEVVVPPDDCGVTTFRYPAGPGAQEVLLSGSFNGWGSTPETADPLSDEDGDGVWEVTLTLSPGTHQYRFVVDGEWLTDPDNPNTVDDGYGGANSVVTVPGCGDPGPGPACGETTFRYAAGAAVVAVFVAGTFNEWSPTAQPLVDPDGDRVFEATVDLAPGRYEYKFVVDGEWLPDPANPDTAPDGFDGVNSVLVVPACPQEGALTLVSHETDETARTFTAVFTAAAAVDPALVAVTVDGAPAPAGALTADADGTTLTLALEDLHAIHDVRVTSGGETLLLKVYVGISTDWRDVGATPRTVTLPVAGVGLADGTRLRPALDDDGPPQTVAGGALTVTVPARTPVIYVTEREPAR